MGDGNVIESRVTRFLEVPVHGLLALDVTQILAGSENVKILTLAHGSAVICIAFDIALKMAARIVNLLLV